MSTEVIHNQVSSASSNDRHEKVIRTRQVSLVALLALVVWGGSVAVGAVGIAHPHDYHTPAPPKKELPPAELIKVELTDAAISEFAGESSEVMGLPLPMETPATPPPVAIDAPELPQLIPVATPETVAFAIPVEGPVQVVEAPKAAYIAPPKETKSDDSVPATVGNAIPAPTRLTFGQGAGRQPAPDYPYQAVRRNQTGTVRIRFTVGENGRVTDAEAVQPCEWDLLNNSAVSAVRTRWRFPSGQERIYEVDIRFEIKDL
jgi:protein TonB